ncbi:MAG TPA: 50S ribosomal protein L25 [Sphaerochaeta sp.]|nr:MAG: 50S ribosomal protein L25 [Spirochaetes bacterium GWC2_52_13]PKL22802.1 MAG: 50S ribosomal protein L25 [Spirochaetae bacterium HGW-Spirochaetae-4]HCG63309.1 50S ribosomal protein L25 [Sphaerochaeta sp.]HCJ94618.1 50S ribosomal protein L25 [Sphaerochaeta sp.]HCS36605.1 50S ribosomal protein L25 [Sphaerochaeta sp.]
MKDTNLTGTLRTEDFGSAGSRRVLAAGRIPAVIYGKGKMDPVHITLDAKDFQNKLRHFSESTLLTIKIGRKNHSVLMKDFQENVMLGKILHVDFFEVTKGEVLRTHVSIVLHGNPDGAKFGGVLEQVTHEIEVECLPKDLPEHIVVDVTKLGLNESIHVASLEVPEGVKILTNGETTVASVKGVKEVIAAPETGETEVEGEEAADEDKE